jgi:saccharopine dehydrogenase-like NADP-dependent oxidoreductase
VHRTQETYGDRFIYIASHAIVSFTVRTYHDRPNNSWTNDPLYSAHTAGVLLMNEIGLDPGIDHCSAHALLSRLRSENNQIMSFTSFCGGLPAPEAAEGVPLGYKFSWSPRGVLRAASEGASFRLAGQVRLSSPARVPTNVTLVVYFS